MSKRLDKNLSTLSMLELFRIETETQCATITTALLRIEKEGSSPQILDTLMRAAHSIKGAARIISVASAVRVAHAMEDRLVAAQKNVIHIGPAEVSLLLKGTDLLTRISSTPEEGMRAWDTSGAEEVAEYVGSLATSTPVDQTESTSGRPPDPPDLRPPPAPPALRENGAAEENSVALRAAEPEEAERVLRLNAGNLNRLLGLASESLVEARWLQPFTASLMRLKRMQTELSETIETLRDLNGDEHPPDRVAEKLQDAIQRASECRTFLSSRIQDLDTFDRRCLQLSHRLYLEALRTRMRPFSDGVGLFPRMVRDLSQNLGKEVRFQVSGENTQVDRDILERLETALAHLLRNAIDHGCEPPEARVAAGKARECSIQIEARHNAGMLSVMVSDDGAGIDPEQVRGIVERRKLLPDGMADRLTEGELLQFLFLPGFTMRDSVTEISGRGVGLDIVQNMVREVRGNIRINTHRGGGTRFVLQIPITLSVVRTLLVEVGGEPYAFPLSQIVRTLRLPRERVETVEGRLCFRFHEDPVGLLSAQQVLDCGPGSAFDQELPVLVLGEKRNRYGLVVDKFIGERELVVQPLDPRLGKVRDIRAAALLEDGSPVLIVDVEDLLQSIDRIISEGRLQAGLSGILPPASRRQKRVLVVDDSLTVRELQRKLLLSRGYAVDVAVDGMDGWNTLRTGEYDLVISDVDMPRADGVQLTEMIRKDPDLRALPIMIVSYKEREEDRLRGLDAGADYYLTKGSFQDEGLLQAVSDLIGEPEE
jgi:two-component system sensor histidine kinase and response regulator WspE